MRARRQDACRALMLTTSPAMRGPARFRPSRFPRRLTQEPDDAAIQRRRLMPEDARGALPCHRSAIMPTPAPGRHEPLDARLSPRAASSRAQITSNAAPGRSWLHRSPPRRMRATRHEYRARRAPALLSTCHTPEILMAKERSHIAP